MKASVIIVIVLVVLAVFGFGFFVLNQNKSSEKMMPSQEMMTSDDSMMKDEVKQSEPEEMMEGTPSGNKMMMGEDSRYLEYSKKSLEETADSRRVLFFYANWCPICRPTDANFKANLSKIPEDVRLIRVNYNDSDTDDGEKALAVKYGITYQHTFVQIDKNGKEVTKWNGGQIEKLLSSLK